MSWGRRSAVERPPTAFTQTDFNVLSHAVQKLAHTAYGVVAEPYTADEMARLFVPPVYLPALRTTFALQSEHMATADIYVSMLHLPDDEPAEPVFDSRDAACLPDSAVVNFEFNREWAGDSGFVTPSPVFGGSMDPMEDLQGSAWQSTDPEDQLLVERFRQQCRLSVRTIGEWAAVAFVLNSLHTTLRTPQQVRYVWPAIHTLASVAGLKEMASALVNPSTRAGTNAQPDPEILAFLKPTYEVVSHSVLLGDRPDMIQRYRTGKMKFVNCFFQTTLRSKTERIGGL